METNTPRRCVATDALMAAASRLDRLLAAWGFSFHFDGVHSSHTGPYATGHYIRDTIRISLSCRGEIDNLCYEQSFVKTSGAIREIETFTISHQLLMQALGHADDCRLIAVNEPPNAIAARDGGARMDALLFDLSNYAAPLLREPHEQFDEIVRTGLRCYRIGATESDHRTG